MTVTAPVRITSIAEVYQAERGDGACTLYLVHPELARQPKVRAAIEAAAKRAIATPENGHLVKTYAAGGTGDELWVLTEALEGTSVKELLARKRQAQGGGGFGARGAGNLLIGVAAGLDAGGVHGGLSSESVIVSRSGKVRVADLALGTGLAVAIAGGLVPGGSFLAPEVAKGGVPSSEADVYGLGALLYEALVGNALERGGPRPSDVVPGLTTTVDELIARCCASTPDKRFGSIEVVKELVADALARGAAVEGSGEKATTPPPGMSSPSLKRPSLAQAIAQPAVDPAISGSLAAAVDPALGAALADTTERWLIAKGRLDYGPFSLADVVAQIKKGDIVAGNVIIDRDTGARMNVHDHPLLGPIVDAAKQSRDDMRRAQAEVAHETKQKKRSVVLFGGIGAAVVVVGVAIYFIVQAAGGHKDAGAGAGVSKVGAAELAVNLTRPTSPPPSHHSGGAGGHGGGGGGGHHVDNGDDSALALDFSDDSDDDDSETLTMDQIYSVYSGAGGQLARCAGGAHAHIAISVDGKSGRVNYTRVNGQKNGGLAECIGGVMQSLQFPKINGTRTRATFDIN